VSQPLVAQEYYLALLLVSGVAYFRRMEASFADVI
jgi:hypothetical protein